MERKTGFAVAGAVVMILVAGAIAAGANLGLLGIGGAKGPAGKLRPSDAGAVTAVAPGPQVITVEVRDPARETTARVSQPAADPGVQIVDVPSEAGPTVSSGGGHESEHESEDAIEREETHSPEDDHGSSSDD